MKRQKIDNQVERRLLTALITSDEFLSQAVAVMDLKLIDTPHVKRIAQWCTEYFQQYRRAPQKDIQTIYYSWVEGKEDSPEAESIRELLEDLSDVYNDKDPLNVPYLVDSLRCYLERKTLQKLYENVDIALSRGNEEEAKKHILSYHPVEITTGSGIDPFRQEDVWDRAFSVSSQPLMEFPGDIGKFLNHSLIRDGLIGIQGPEKRGKTWWCIEFVVRALKARRKVAFFQVGDLSEHQVMIRLGMYFAERPSRDDQCGIINVPLEILKPEYKKGQEDDKPEETAALTVRTRSRTFTKPLTRQACIKACKKLMRACGLSPNKSYLKVSIHSNSSINVLGIRSILDRWEMLEGFIPDVIVVDYADILAPEDPCQAVRDQVNDTWKALRRLSQDRHCLIIVPTQANRESYDARIQQMKHSSEDKRKLAHVTGMLGLNQTEEEKEVGVMRLNWIVLRENPFNVRQCLWVGQCLPIGRAFYCATL